MEIFKPIFIVGSPRSGTTLLYEYLAMHKSLAWFSQHDHISNFTHEYLEFINFRRRIFGIRNWSYPGRNHDVRYRTSFEFPDEYGSFWNMWIGKTWATEKDATEKVRHNLIMNIKNLLNKKNKTRFLNKNPPHSVRIRLLREVFPDALFINIIRDGRAVVASMINSMGGTKYTENYFGIPLKNNDQMNYEILERHARQWIEVNEEIQNAKKYLKENQYFEIKYEKFIEDPKENIMKIQKFCELDDHDIFEKPMLRLYGGKLTLTTEKLQSRNDKWKKQFSEDEIISLEKIMSTELKRFEYS